MQHGTCPACRHLFLDIEPAPDMEYDSSDGDYEPEEDEEYEEDEEEDGDERTMLRTASSTHSRIRFFMSVLSGAPARRLLSAQLFASCSTDASGACNDSALFAAGGSTAEFCGAFGSVARIVTCRTTSPMSERHFFSSSSRLRSARSCLLDEDDRELPLPLLELELELGRGRFCM